MALLRKSILVYAVSSIVVAASILPSHAQTPPAAGTSTGYTPQSGQPGKDVVWVPTPQALVDRMLEMAAVTPQDYLVDLGSGDGRTVITAAKRGVRAHGIEYNPDLVRLSQQAARTEGVADRATFAQGDIFQSDFSDATVVTLFLLASLNIRLRPILLDMPAGTRIVSNSFDMGDWQPDQRADAVAGCSGFCRALMWVVPAKVAGTWRLDGGELRLDQSYQMLSGTLTLGGQSQPITDARMTGNAIIFSAGGRRYTGTFADGGLSGVVDGGAAWSASRTDG